MEISLYRVTAWRYPRNHWACHDPLYPRTDYGISWKSPSVGYTTQQGLGSRGHDHISLDIASPWGRAPCIPHSQW